MNLLLLKEFLAVVIMLLFLFTGCSTSPKPFEYESNRDLKPGPGLFSGDDGVFTIYSAPASSDEEAGDHRESKEEGVKHIE